MTRFTCNDTPPDWCELRSFARHAPSLGHTTTVIRSDVRARLLMTRGRCQVGIGPQSAVLRAGQYLDLPETLDSLTATATTNDAEFLWLCGTWGDHVAGCGIWTVMDDPDATDAGDPVDYPKRTRMDRHYHDYDEYWFVLEGSAVGVVGDTHHDVTAGDCLALPAGHPHDLPIVHETMRGAFFETTLRGGGRLGHLWEHTHGPAPRDPDRV